MADNVTLPGTGQAVAADDIGSAKYQRIKLIKGADGTNDGDITEDNPFPVEEHYEDMDFSGDGTPPINSVGTATTSSAISCDGKSKIILHTEYSDSVGTAPIIIILMDFNVTQAESWVGPVTPANSGISLNPIETNYYQGDTIVVDANGAKEFKIRVNDTPSAGNVSVFAAVV